MVSHSLAIAKASLAAACIRPDPTPVPRDQVNAFHGLLDAALERCSRQNVQRCKQWLVVNVLQSTAKVAAIAKYLVALSASLKDEPSDKSPQGSPRRKQLHVLYLLSDVLHATKFHGASTDAFDALVQALSKPVADLLVHAASYDPETYPRHHSRLSQLLDVWGRQQYFPESLTGDLRDILCNPESGKTLATAPAAAAGSGEAGNEPKKEVPFEMPACHGDPSAPYYDLPAATMLPHIVPHKKAPIDPRQMAALRFKPGPAEKALVSAVKSYLRDADVLYGLVADEDADVSVQLDEIGQLVYQDRATGEVVGGENYYGWSRRFCERMKRPPSEPSSRIRSRGQSDDRRRRRHSSSMDRSRSRSYSRSPPRQRRKQSRSRSRDSYRSHSNSRSRSPRGRRRGGSPPRHGSRKGLVSLQSALPPFSAPQAFHAQNPPPYAFAQPPPLPFPFPSGVPLGPNGLPMPPPRPPNWIGPWPPVPPPPGSGLPLPPNAFPGFTYPPQPPR